MNALSALPPRPAGALHRDRLWFLLCALVALASHLGAGAQAQTSALPAVVVWDFENQTPGGAQAMSASDYLKRSLSENLTISLLNVAGLPVVERQRLKDLLAEQRISATELADQDARVRLGRIVGAARMVFGGYFVLGDAVQVHLRVVDTASSRVIFSDEITAPLQGVMQEMAPLNRRLARALGGTASADASYAADSWKRYDDALALADAGQLEAAVQALQSLLIKDKHFLPAERQMVALLEKMARR